MRTVSELQDEIISNRYNPSAILRLTMNQLEGTIDIVDPTNPFVFLMETSAINASATMINNEAILRQLYPSMAINEEELYLHMSDVDYLDRFATPTVADFKILLSKDEFISKAVEVPNGNNKLLTIPRNTEFKVSNLTFTLNYPIDIRLFSSGSIQCLYDTELSSPIETISNNVIDFKYTVLDNNEYILISIPVMQTGIDTKYEQVSASSGFKGEFAYIDQYYYTRVYIDKGDGKWIELLTTHTDQVFDPSKPTATLQVFEDKLVVDIPQVYIDSGLVKGTVRVDIFTTKGNVEVSLESYNIDSFTVRWIDRELGDSVTPYSLPIKTFSNMGVFSDSVINGGSSGLDTDTVRERMLTNSLGNSQLPITENQLLAKLSSRGYTGIKYIDNITDRTYLATRKLPKSTLTAISSTIFPFTVDLMNISTEGINVRDNSAVITPNVLFNLDGNELTTLTQQDLYELRSSNKETLAKIVNGKTILKTPFHYVLDDTDKFYESRIYSLEDPTVIKRELLITNSNSVAGVTLTDISIETNNEGFSIFATTASTDAFKDIDNELKVPTISFTPEGLSTRVYSEGILNSILESGEYLYRFDIKTDFILDKEDLFKVINFKSRPLDSTSYNLALTDTFIISFHKREFVYGELLVTGINKPYYLDQNSILLSEELLEINLGKRVNNLWSKDKKFVEPIEYATYSEDQFMYYKDNIYETDPNTNITILTLQPDGSLGYNLLHSKGDIVLDPQGEPIVEFPAGSIMYDLEGNPIPLESSTLKVTSDLLLIDAKYTFSDNIDDKIYLESIPKTIISWLETDIETFRNWTLEQTELFLYLQKTIGYGKFLILDGEEVELPIEQSFIVTFYLDRNNFTDLVVRESLKETAIRVISDKLLTGKVYVNEIISELTESNVTLGIDVRGLGGKLDLTSLTVIDDTTRPTIRKKLDLNIDGNLRVIDDVEVLFVKHES